MGSLEESPWVVNDPVFFFISLRASPWVVHDAIL